MVTAHKLVKPTGISFALGVQMHYGHRKCSRFINIIQQIVTIQHYMPGRPKIYNSLLCEMGCLKQAAKTLIVESYKFTLLVVRPS